LVPQPHTDPSRCNATVWSSPAATMDQFVPDPICTGEVNVPPIVPTPSAPLVLEPQPQSVPSRFSPSACPSALGDTETQSVSAAIRVSAAACPPSVGSPSWPVVLSPNPQRAPLDFTANEDAPLVPTEDQSWSVPICIGSAQGKGSPKVDEALPHAHSVPSVCRP